MQEYSYFYFQLTFLDAIHLFIYTTEVHYLYNCSMCLCTCNIFLIVYNVLLISKAMYNVIFQCEKLSNWYHSLK